MIKSYYIVHDCETGGLDPMSNPLTQYAAIILDYNTLKEIDRFETYVKPYDNLTIEQQALDHTMQSMTDIRNGMEMPKFVKALGAFYDKYRVKGNRDRGRLVSVGHNVNFDHMFLTYAFARNDMDIFDYFQDAFIDTMVLSKMTWGVEGNERMSLQTCCERAGVELVDAHGAMNDVLATADLFRFFISRIRSTNTTAKTNKNNRKQGEAFFAFDCGAFTK